MKKEKLDASFTAYNDSIWRYHKEFGYSYKKNMTFFHLEIKNGKPVFWRKACVNQYGNQGKPNVNYKTSKNKILIFGDSFTAYFHDGKTWPCLLVDKINNLYKADVQIMNFGRDGYGILQIFDLAVAKTKEFNPDCILILFITDDLQRDRFWRTCCFINGLKRVFTTTKPFEVVDPRFSVDIAILNQKINEEWCKYIVETQNQKDNLLLELIEQFVFLQQSNQQSISGNPSHNYSSFYEDIQIKERINELNDMNVQYYLMHLPTYGDFKCEKYVMDNRDSKLLDSLSEITGKKIINMMQSGMKDFPGLEDYYLLPHDPHPSLKGLDLYSDLVLYAIKENNII